MVCVPSRPSIEAPIAPAEAARLRRCRRLAAWEASLPAKLAAAQARWGFMAQRPLPPGGSPARLFAVRLPDGADAVLKLAPAGQGLEAEATALAAFDGQGAARLLAADLGLGALLLERLAPGTKLRDLAARDDDAATRAAALLLRALPRRPPPGGAFATAAGWGRALAGAEARRRLPPSLLDRAGALLHDLTASAPEAPLLLHGDLHHDNILADGGSGCWRAVDPKGLLGEPAFEAAPFLRNPPGSPLLARAPRRIEILAETAGLERPRVAAWGYVGAALAACWAIEDGTDPSPWLAAASAITSCLP